MFGDLSKRPQRIDDLLREPDTARLRYAALEARLGLEEIARQFIESSQKYINPEDLASWQPGRVMQSLEELVDPTLSQGKKLSISKDPADGGITTQGQFESVEYIDIGEQPNLKLREFSKLWNALSRYLHIGQIQDSQGSAEFDAETAVRKINQAVSILKEFDRNGFILVSPREIVTFDCVCSTKNSRAIVENFNGMILRCINPNCPETWQAIKEAEDISFKRLVVSVECKNCGKEMVWPESKVTALQLNRIYPTRCASCGKENRVKWHLAMAETS